MVNIMESSLGGLWSCQNESVPMGQMCIHYHPLFLRNVLREHLLVEETQLFPGKRVSLLWAEEWGRRPSGEGHWRRLGCVAAKDSLAGQGQGSVRTALQRLDRPSMPIVTFSTLVCKRMLEKEAEAISPYLREGSRGQGRPCDLSQGHTAN